MVDFDDLRRSTNDDEDFLEEDLEDDPFEAATARENARLFLGMTPVERMLLSMFLFMNVAVLGVALLLATGRMG